MKLKPTKDIVLVKPLGKPQRTPSGIVLPDKAVNQVPQRGRVVAVGKNNIGIKKDDVVIFKKFEGLRYKPEVTGRTFIFLKISDILAIEEGEK